LQALFPSSRGRLEIDLERNDCHAFLADFVPHFADFLLVQQQPSAAFGSWLKRCLFVRGYMGFNEPGFLAVLYIDIGLSQADLPGAHGFNLRTLQESPASKCSSRKYSKPALRFVATVFTFSVILFKIVT